MFGMNPMNVLDLINNNSITIITKEDEEPEISKYSIVDNQIIIEKFQDKLKFRIEELEVSELKLTLYLDFKVNEQNTIKDDILEMIFEVYK